MFACLCGFEARDPNKERKEFGDDDTDMIFASWTSFNQHYVSFPDSACTYNVTLYQTWTDHIAVKVLIPTQFNIDRLVSKSLTTLCSQSQHPLYNCLFCHYCLFSIVSANKATDLFPFTATHTCPVHMNEWWMVMLCKFPVFSCGQRFQRFHVDRAQIWNGAKLFVYYKTLF